MHFSRTILRRKWSWQNATPLVLSAALFVAPFTSVIIATPANAATQGGTCNAFAGAVPLGAKYSDATVTVPTCGPRPYYGGPLKRVYPYPGAPRFTPGYQCVEFSERFIYHKFGLGAPNTSTNGDQIVDHYAGLYPSKFVVEDASHKVAPAQGDVLSFSTSPTFSSGTGGHTAVVQTSNVNAAGAGTVTIIEENASPTGTRTLTVQGWKIQGTGYTYIKWLHYKNAPLPPPGPGTTGRALDLVFAIDTTGSMSPYISSVVKATSTIVDLLDAAHADYRIGLVDYKDTDYGCPNYDAITDLGFSTSRTAIESALSNLESKIYGGCDIPEDVYSGISRALGFPWRSGVTKAVIFMGDAPGHDPEPHSGLTLSSIKAQAAAVDPAQAYAILVGSDPDAHQFDQAIADATGGQTFDATSDPSMAGTAFVNAIQTILSSLQPSTTTLTASTNTLAAGAPVQFRATVSPGSDSGSVTFLANGEPLLTCQGEPVDTTGTATCNTTFATGGTYDIEAVYSGNDNEASSTSNTVSLAVTGACSMGKELGQLVVPAGGSACIGPDSVVNGGISVTKGGALYVFDATIHGHVAAKSASAVLVCGATSNGGLDISGSTGGVAIGDVDGQLPCRGNTINGTISVTDNTAGVAVSDNVISGALILVDNSGTLPPPDSGSVDDQNNQVKGPTTIR